MTIGVIGAGAIGGLAAGLLARAGHPVRVLARGATLAALRLKPLRLELDGQTIEVPLPASDRPADIGPCRLVVLAVKAYGVGPAVAGLAPMLDPDSVVLAVQNGIPWYYFHGHGGPLDGTRLATLDPDGGIAAAVAPERVVGAVTYAAASVIEPGRIRVGRVGEWRFGEPDRSRSARLAEIVTLFARAGFDAEAVDLRAAIWAKLLGNATFNPVSVLTRATVDRMMGDPGTAAVILQAMRQVASVALGLGVALPTTVEARFAEAANLGRFKTSMLQDAEAGRPLEIEALLGVVVEIAERLGLPVPTLDCVLALTGSRRRFRSRTAPTRTLDRSHRSRRRPDLPAGQDRGDPARRSSLRVRPDRTQSRSPPPRPRPSRPDARCPAGSGRRRDRRRTGRGRSPGRPVRRAATRRAGWCRAR